MSDDALKTSLEEFQIMVSFHVLDINTTWVLSPLDFFKSVVSNSNWTEGSTIQGVIAGVISKSDEREARGRFEITNTITP